MLQSQPLQRSLQNRAGSADQPMKRRHGCSSGGAGGGADTRLGWHQRWALSLQHVSLPPTSMKKKKNKACAKTKQALRQLLCQAPWEAQLHTSPPGAKLQRRRVLCLGCFSSLCWVSFISFSAKVASNGKSGEPCLR